MGEFQVINSDSEAERKNKFMDALEMNELLLIWNRQMQKHLVRLNSKIQSGLEGESDDFNHISFTGAKCISLTRRARSKQNRAGIKVHEGAKNAKENLEEIQTLLIFMMNMTYRDFITTFPITKTYDGEKWGCKDYFYTMKHLEGYNLDERIGAENLKEMLWEYQNPLIAAVGIELMAAVDEMQRQRGKKTFMDMVMGEVAQKDEPQFSIVEDEKDDNHDR